MAYGRVVVHQTSPVKQYSYENDFSGVFDAFLHQSFLFAYVMVYYHYRLLTAFCISSTFRLLS